MAKINVLGVLNRYLADDATPGNSFQVEIFDSDGTFNTNNYKTSYTTSALTTANSNPVDLDSTGKPDTGGEIWVNGDCDVRIKDADGVTIDSIEGINPTDVATTDGNFNAIQNGSFEDWSDTDPDNWTVTRIGTVEADTSVNSEGKQSAKFTSTGSGGGTIISSAFISCSEQITLLVMFKLVSSVVDIRNLVEIIWYDDNETQLSTTSIYDESAANPLVMTLKTGLATPPSTARFYKMQATGAHSSDPTSGSTWYDGFRVHPLVFGDIYSDQTIAGDKIYSGKATFNSLALLKVGSAVATAATVTLATDGNISHWTGTNDVDDITHITGDGPFYGIVDDIFTFKHVAGKLELPGKADITTAVDDRFTLVQDGTTWVMTDFVRAGNEKIYAGDIVQEVTTSTGSLITGTTTMPDDDSIPQITEGVEVLTLAITPKSSTNILRIDIYAQISHSANSGVTGAIFQDSTADALTTGNINTGSSGNMGRIVLTHWMTAGTTNTTTFKVRCGGSAAGTLTVNGFSSNRKYFGTANTRIIITEIKS